MFVKFNDDVEYEATMMRMAMMMTTITLTMLMSMGRHMNRYNLFNCKNNLL